MTPSLERNPAVHASRPAMDIPRPDLAAARRRRRIWTALATVLGLAFVTFVVVRLEPAAPSIDRTGIWPGTVQRGQMLRQVRGPGSLVPEQIQYVQAETDGRVERIFIQPGAEVTPDSILMELSNPELKQAAFDAEWARKAADAQLERLRASLESDRLSQLAQITTLRAELAQAMLEAEADEILARDGLVPQILRKKSRSKADDLKARAFISVASSTAASSSISRAVAAPASRSTSCTSRGAMGNPSRAIGAPNRAVSADSRMSQQQAISTPAPMQLPSICAMMGRSHASMAPSPPHTSVS